MDGVMIWAVARPLSATLSVFGSKPTRDNIVGIHQMLFWVWVLFLSILKTPVTPWCVPKPGVIFEKNIDNFEKIYLSVKKNI